MPRRVRMMKRKLGEALGARTLGMVDGKKNSGADGSGEHRDDRERAVPKGVFW